MFDKLFEEFLERRNEILMLYSQFPTKDKKKILTFLYHHQEELKITADDITSFVSMGKYVIHIPEDSLKNLINSVLDAKKNDILNEIEAHRDEIPADVISLVQEISIVPDWLKEAF